MLATAPALAAGQRARKKTKAGVLVCSITYADLQACFSMPTERACVKLGVGLTILKRLCRKFGIARWPYRTLMKAGKARKGGSTDCLMEVASASPQAATTCMTPVGADKSYLQAASSQTSPAEGNTVSQTSPHPYSSQQQQQQQASYVAISACAAPAAAYMQLATEAAAAARNSNVAPEGVGCSGGADQAQASECGSHMDVLLSAIDATAALDAPHSPVSPSLAHQSAWTPFNQQLHLAQAPLAAAAACPRRPFSHSQGSLFKPVAQRASVSPRPAPPAAEATALLLQQLVQVQRRQQQSAAAAASGAVSTVQTPVATLLLPPMSEQQRWQLAAKLLLVRAALQARIARKRASGAAPARSGRSSPYPAPVTAANFASSPPSAASTLAAPDNVFSCLAGSLSSQDAQALISARSLLAQYQL